MGSEMEVPLLEFVDEEKVAVVDEEKVAVFSLLIELLDNEFKQYKREEYENKNFENILKNILLLITKKDECHKYINKKFNKKNLNISHIGCKKSRKINDLYNLLKELHKYGLEQRKQEVYKLLIEISSNENENEFEFELNIIKNMLSKSEKEHEKMLLNSKKRKEMNKSLKDNDDNILKIINIDGNDNYLYIVYNTINIYNKLCENGIILSEIEPRAEELSENIITKFKDIKKEDFEIHKKFIMCMIAVEYIKEMELIMNRLIDYERLDDLKDTLEATLKDFMEMSKKYKEYIDENDITIKGLQNGGNAKVTKINKKEICGRERCIYKKPGDRKEYLKHKGELITVKDYKKRMKDKK
jgi:hypothetical protein